MTRERTEQKLRYVQLHLDELAAVRPGRGDDFERAHHEAALAQLYGAYDSFLGELNVILGCQRAAIDVGLSRLRESLQKQGRSSAVLDQLHELQQDPKSWLGQLQDLRHASTHRKAPSLAFHLGGPKDHQESFRHPETLEELPETAAATLGTWLQEMAGLIAELRLRAISEGTS
jgi:hypothetical protein